METKILVVDDSKIMRRIIRKELENSGYKVFEAENGMEAFNKTKELLPQLITMDVDMPVMNGFDAVHKIRSELKPLSADGNKEIPIIFITANDTIEGRKKGFQVGATDFIVKPFLKGEVIESVNNLLKSDTNLMGMTVLLVEDSDLIRKILNNILTGEGIKTIQAANGVEAFEIMKTREDLIDMVITDFIMPEMDGDELCRKIRQDLGNRSVPIIFLSAMSETSSMLKIFKVGASDYLIKPFAKEELLARISVHLESRLLNKKLFNQVHALKRLNKLQDDFLSITSHDLRSPLNGILGFTDLLLEDLSLNEQHQDFLKHIKESGDFLLTLINDILDLGRTQSENHQLEMIPLSVIDLMESSVNTVQHMATPKAIRLISENKCKKTPLISGNENALVRIFNNLLSNAIKFTNKNGEVRPLIEIIDNNELCISITDTGIGIPAEKIPLLFDKFSTASREGTFGEKSTGLGLSITKELIERHNGTIEVSSIENKGSCFKIILPLLGMSDEAPEKATTQIDNKNKSTRNPDIIHVLLADDNKLNIKLATLVMEKKGFKVTSVSNGMMAMEYYIDTRKEKTRAFDIIFMDLKMPIMDGFEATQAIRHYEKENSVIPIPIIAMTAGTDKIWKEKSREMGLNAYLTKPININQVEEIIARFIPIDKDQTFTKK